METKLYLAMTGEGRVVGVEDGGDDSTVFVERVLGPYIAYLSRHWAHLGYHLAIKKSGKVKNGKQTLYPWGQHAVKFLHRPAFPSPHPIKVLENLHGMRLSVSEDGVVYGERGESINSDMEISPGPHPDTVRLKAVQSGLYISMDSEGKLAACKEEEAAGLKTIFIEEIVGPNTVSYLCLR